ncbi:MAG: nucleotidyltransferase domain-containing protein [Bacilli bacterium]
MNMELKEIRLKNKLTQKEASEILNISRRSYQTYEKGVSINKDKYSFLCEKLDKMFLIDEEHGILTIDEIKIGVAAILNKYDVKACYLFGSYAKNKANEKSDIDLLIDSSVTGLNFFGLVEELREKLNKKIDLLNKDQILNNPELLSEILKDGIKIYG